LKDRSARKLTIRVYQPKKEILDGTYKVPPVRRVQQWVEPRYRRDGLKYEESKHGG
jgi:hypothetical protein